MDATAELIRDLARKYVAQVHGWPKTFAFRPGTDKIHYSQHFFDEEETLNLIDVALSQWMTAGKWTEQFETSMLKYFGARDVLLVNSGSSANLLMLATLCSKEIAQYGLRPLQDGDEVITVAAGFPTTLAPIIQNRLVPVFVDVGLGTYNPTFCDIVAAVGPRTRAVMLPHPMGLPFDCAAVKYFCAKNGLFFLEDNCFTGRTKVNAKRGVVSISDLKVGDKLLGFNGTKFVETTVSETANRLVHKDDVLAIYFKNGTSLRCTKNHPFYVNEKWVRADKLSIGDEIYQPTHTDICLWKRIHKLTEAGRQRVSEMMKLNNPSFDHDTIRRSSTNRKKRITHVERRIIEAINQHGLPIQYVGDGSFWVGSSEVGFKNPDFIAIDKKLVFEVYDPNYKNYSVPRDEIWENERAAFYSQFGYETKFIKLSGWINKQQRSDLAVRLRKSVSNGLKIIRIVKDAVSVKVNFKKEPDDMVRVYNIKCAPYPNFCLANPNILTHNCDALGSRFDGKLTGTFGDMSSLSHYPAHMISCGEGGSVVINNVKLKIPARSVMQWGRSCHCNPGCENTCGKRFTWDKAPELPPGTDHKYIYDNIGYNLQATDMQAAVLCAQFDKLGTIIGKRQENFNTLHAMCRAELADYFILPRWDSRADPSPYAYPLINNSGVPTREIIAALEAAKIETRPIFAGNLLRQPAFSGITHRVHGTLANTDRIMHSGFFVGVHPGLNEEHMRYIFDTLKKAVTSRVPKFVGHVGVAGWATTDCSSPSYVPRYVGVSSL